MLSRVLKFAGIYSQEERELKLYNDLKEHEAEIGGKLFGPVPAGVKRVFYCQDDTTWVWREEWTDKNGQKKNTTIRYEFRPDSVVKVLNNGKYQLLSKNEAARFFQAIKAFERNVRSELYRF